MRSLIGPVGQALPARRQPTNPLLRRVLYLVVLDPSQKFGSLEEQLFLLAQAFQQQSSLFLPLFSCATDPSEDKAILFHNADLPAECLDLRRFGPRPLRRLARLIRQHRIEIVHWNFFPPLANPYLWGLTLLCPGLKHYITDHSSRFTPPSTPPPQPKRLIKHLLLRRYHKVLGVSQFVQECLEAQRVWHNLSCCLHFVNTDRFKPDPAVRAEMRQRHGVEDRFVVATVGQLIDAKGIDVFLKALAELPEDVVGWVLGTGEGASRLRQLADQLDLGRRVTFLGLQRHIQPYLQAADCFVCPSLWAEAAGLVNLEASACGLPVLASRVGGIPEYVTEGEGGHLFPPGDHLQLAQLLRELQASPAHCRATGERARAHTVRRFSAESRLPLYLDLYRTP